MRLSDPVGNTVALRDLRAYTHYQLDIRSRDYFGNNNINNNQQQEYSAEEGGDQETAVAASSTEQQEAMGFQPGINSLYLSMNFSTAGIVIIIKKESQ